MQEVPRLRQLIESGEQVIAPGAYDALTARVAVQLGFNGVYLGGFASSAHLAVMEPLMTMTEQIGLARRIAEVIGDVPLIVDGHTGYGESVHITRAVQAFEAAGVSAIHIEDQVYPKRVGYHAGVTHMVTIEEMQERIRVACDARRSTNFVIIARSEARGAVGESLDELVTRLTAYAEAGADILMPMPNNREEAEYLRSVLPTVPLFWTAGMGRFADGEEVHLDDLKELGYQVVVYPLVGIVRAVEGFRHVFQRLKEVGVVDVTALDEGYEHILELIDAPTFYDIENRTTQRPTVPS
jgi:2-methylisocitrate lyase-like PEP mutase family enzyme